MSRTLENTIVRLLRSSPFYGHLLVGLRKSIGRDGFPVGVTLRGGAPTLTLDEPTFAAHSPGEQEALLEHCILHLLHLHPLRRKERNPRDWDLACDLSINGIIAKLPSGAPRPENYSLPESLAAEEYYRLLVDPFDSGSISGSGSGSAEQDTAGKSGQGDDGGKKGTGPEEAVYSPTDDHRVWEEADSTPLRLAEEMVRDMIHEAFKKCDGEIPAELRPLVESLLAPGKLPWRLILRQFVATAGRVGKKSSWQREHRRFEHSTPGSRKRHRLNLLIGIDVSESTDSQELRESFALELLHIARGRESILTVVYANSSVQKIATLRGSPLVVESYHGGGFTDLRPVFEHARAMKPRPAAVIYLTDGAGPAPEKMEFPTLWVLTQEGKKPVPWGVELRLEN